MDFALWKFYYLHFGSKPVFSHWLRSIMYLEMGHTVISYE